MSDVFRFAMLNCLVVAIVVFTAMSFVDYEKTIWGKVLFWTQIAFWSCVNGWLLVSLCGGHV